MAEVPEQFGSYGGAYWQDGKERQTRGLDGRELGVIERRKARGEGVPGAQVDLCVKTDGGTDWPGAGGW